MSELAFAAICLVALALAAIAARHDLREIGSGGVAALAGCGAAGMIIGMAAHASATATTALGLIWLFCALIAEIDRQHMVIPDPLVAALLLLALTRPFGIGEAEALAGMCLLGAVFFAVRGVFALRGVHEALGLGDVKLAAAMGALLGAQPALLCVGLAGLSTLVVAAPRLQGDALAAQRIPFGVGLAAALAVAAAVRVWLLR